jgi:transcriptional regulator with XRE-family HTH domain
LSQKQWEWLGQNIAHYRHERRLSQRELAAIVGVARQTVTRWEAGQTQPERKHLTALTKLFKVPLGALFTKPGSPPGARAAPAAAPDPTPDVDEVDEEPVAVAR